MDRMSDISAIVLAAGKGTRMKSTLPKVLHALCGRALVEYPIAAAFEAGAGRVVLVGSRETELEQSLVPRYGAERLQVVVQDPPRGTGDAVRVGLSAVESARVLVLYGDTPLVRAQDLSGLLAALDHPGVALSLLTALLEEPRGYGRVLRDAAGNVSEVREERDLRSDSERAVREVNAGMYAAASETLRRAVAELTPNNAQGELYLTDIVASIARAARVITLLGQPEALLGVNDRSELARAEALLYARLREQHQKNGVTIHGDARVDAGVELGCDVELGPGVWLRGKTRIGERTRVDCGSVLTDANVGRDAEIKAYCVIERSSVGDAARIGPFAHLRPDSEIGPEAHIGNFVETKKTRVQRGAKANHLSYLGDTDVGERANIGAGTIVCNYDGFAKRKTVIGEGAFIGSDTHLVAPVTIGKNTYVATGTTVIHDVPDDALAIGRVRQENKPGYAAKLRERLAEKQNAQKKR
jgi:bifunctional UDP-N-acetylglucosamine pyrophosphorylase/glucosamine-1-phosphate N-acetyltransferase